jgi:4-amino-4-deoxy-L-arabinose transferase-like glycosyltransferase
MDAFRSRRLILAAAGVAILVRLAFGLLYWTNRPLTHDEREYLSLAASLAAGRGFTYTEPRELGTSPQFGRAPGYPAFVAVFRPDAAASASPASIKAVQSLLGAVAVVLIAAIARRAAGDRAAVIAAWLAALYPPLAWISGYVLSEALYLPLILACVLWLDRANTSTRAALAGMLVGAAVLVRPGTLVFVPLAALWLVRRGSMIRGAAFALAVALVVLPWTVRNLRTHGTLVLVASEGGVTFWTGNHPLARGEGDLAANPDLKRAEIAFRQGHSGLSPEALEPLYYQDALRQIRAQPGPWAVLLLKKAFYTFVPIGPSYTLHSARYLLATVAPYAMLVPLAIAGLIVIARRGQPPHYLYLLAASVVLTSLIFFPQERFRIPVIDPLAVVCAAAALGAVARERS